MLRLFWIALGADPLGSERLKVPVCLDQILARMMCNVYMYVCGLDRLMC